MDTKEFIVARNEIQKRLEAQREQNLPEMQHPFWGVWPALNWLWPTLLAVGLKKSLSGVAGHFGLGWLVPKDFLNRDKGNNHATK